MPVAWLVSTAYKPGSAIFSSPPTLLFSPTLDNFRTVLGLFDIAGLIRSSLVISLGSAALSLLLGAPAGYALARAKSRYAMVRSPICSSPSEWCRRWRR